MLEIMPPPANVLEAAFVYLQAAVALMVAGYLLLDWSRLWCRTHVKQKERPGLLVRNWSLPDFGGLGQDSRAEDRLAIKQTPEGEGDRRQ